MSDLRNKFIYQFSFAATQILFPLITYPYLTRTIGPEGIGKVSYVEFVAGLVITLAAFGIPYYGVREIAKRKDQPAQRQKLVTDLLFIHLLSTLAGLIVFVIFALTSPQLREEPSLVFLGTFNIILSIFMAEWYLQGREAFKFITIRSIIARVLGVAAIFLLVRTTSDYVTYYGITIAIQLVVCIIGFGKLLSENKLRRDPSPRSHVKSLSYFFLTTSMISVYVFFDTIILGYLTDATTVGYYAFALRIIKLSLLLVLTLNTILFPRISNLISTGDMAGAQRLFNRSVSFIFTVTIPLSVLFYALAPEIVALLGGDAFQPSVQLIRILSALPLVIGLSNFFVLQVLIPFHKEKKLMVAVITGSLLSVALNFWLIPLYQQTGAAIAILFTEIVVTVLTGIFAYPWLRRSFDGNLIFQSLAYSIPFLLITFYLREFFPQAIISLSLSLVICGLLYFFCQRYLSRNEIFLYMTDFLRRTPKNRETETSINNPGLPL